MTTISFDEQAESFEQRAGIPEPYAARVAEAVIELGGLAHGGRLLELGAGTGQIGAQLLVRGVDYLALDLSPGMLGVFARRIAPEHHPRLLVGDAEQRWPVDDGSLRAVFSSRAAHLLEPRKLWQEARRTAEPAGAWLLIGRRARDPASVRASLRRRMHELLADEGIEPRSGGNPQRMLDAMAGPGEGTRCLREVARWPVVHRPIDALEAWRSKSGLAGLALDHELEARVLDRLEHWARACYGDLEAEHASEERYELHGLRVPGSSG